MTLTWRPPEVDGGSSISGYIIERKEARSDRWLRINKNYVTMTRYRSSGLVEGLEYEHRITAVNSRGAGKPSESSAITVAMDPIGECEAQCNCSAAVKTLNQFNSLKPSSPILVESYQYRLTKCLFVLSNRASRSTSAAQSHGHHQDFSLSCLAAT